MKITYRFLIVLFTLVPFSATHATIDKTENADSVLLNELIVEAPRTEIKLKSMSGSVTLLNSNQITTLGINALTDITTTVPNLFMPDYGSKLTSPIYIRGIGSRINAPSVGLYVDNVPYFEKAAFNFDFFDINRIEVLRGPQGSEYGRNTMGGIVNIKTKSPFNYQGTDLNLQAASYGSYLMNISHYQKPSNSFAWSLALNYRHNDGFFTNSFTNNKVDVLDSYGFRNRLIWLINERFSIENIASYEDSKQGGYPYAPYFSDIDSVGAISYNQKSGYNRQLASDALLLKYKGHNYSLTATTAYQFLKDKQFIDQDFSKDSINFVVQQQKQNMLSQEITLHTKPNKHLALLFGTYGFIQHFFNDVNVATYRKNTVSLKEYDHLISGFAFFQQTTISNFPIKNLTLTLGIRMDSENDKMGYIQRLSDKSGTKLLVDTTYKSLSSLQILPKVALNYQIENTNVYALVSKGYKTGGFNTTFERPEDLTFNPEYSWNYEFGVKSTLFNQALFTEASVFYIDWFNQQIYQSTPSGVGSMLKNAGKSVSKGFELSVNTASVYGFDLMANYGYTFAQFVENVLNASTNYSGKFIPYVPRHTAAVQLRKSINIAHSKIVDKVVISALYKGIGDIYWNEKNLVKQTFYNTLDGRISFQRKNVQLDVWGTNLTNTQYHAFYFEASGKKYVQNGRPLQVGLRLALKF